MEILEVLKNLMAEFISTFTTGFKEIIQEDFPKRLPGAKIISIYDGLVHYQFAGNSREIEKIIYFNNTFFIFKTIRGKNINFQALVNEVCNSKKYFLINKGTFRVRFSKENQFAKVEKNIAKRAEDDILRNSKLKLDRLSPSTEIWYAVRSEGFAFCGQLLYKREFTEKNLNKGELRPELAYLICCFAEVSKNDVILEPFCGYGAIPFSLAKYFSFSALNVFDIDDAKIQKLKDDGRLKKENIKISCDDAFLLSDIADSSVSLVITDPPWGLFEDVGDISLFYEKMLRSFLRVLKKDGRIVILTARKEEFEKSAEKNGFVIKKSVHTLVNGKKTALYYLEQK